MRLQIRPGLHTVWRGPGAVQIGLDPEYGTVLEGLTGDDRALVAALVDGVDAPALERATAGSARLERLVALLARSGVVVRARSGRERLAELGADVERLAPDAAAWGLARPGAEDGWEVLAARRRCVVEVRGGGRVALVIATVLAAAGVGDVRPAAAGVVAAADVAPGGATLAEVGLDVPAAARVAAGRVRAAPPPGAAGAGPDLVVLVGVGVADSVAAEQLLAADVPHLAVVVRERGLVVGPLVVPGEGPCLRCLDLHRADRDPAWPRLLAQLLARPPRPAGESACGLLGAALAALQVLGHLDGAPRPAALGATLEVDLPDGLTSRRPWQVHPACGCT